MRKASQLRIGLLMGLSVIAMAAPALAQSPSRPAKKPAIKSAAITTPITMGVPHTLDQALATVYMNQPVLQAERAKLRATDEDVPQAEAGWKPTVIVAGSAGYGDGVTRQFLAEPGDGKKSKRIATSPPPRPPSRSRSIPAARPRRTSIVPKTS